MSRRREEKVSVPVIRVSIPDQAISDQHLALRASNIWGRTTIRKFTSQAEKQHLFDECIANLDTLLTRVDHQSVFECRAYHQKIMQAIETIDQDEFAFPRALALKRKGIVRHWDPIEKLWQAYKFAIENEIASIKRKNSAFENTQQAETGVPDFLSPTSPHPKPLVRQEKFNLKSWEQNYLLFKSAFEHLDNILEQIEYEVNPENKHKHDLFELTNQKNQNELQKQRQALDHFQVVPKYPLPSAPASSDFTIPGPVIVGEDVFVPDGNGMYRQFNIQVYNSFPVIPVSNGTQRTPIDFNGNMLVPVPQGFIQIQKYIFTNASRVQSPPLSTYFTRPYMLPCNYSASQHLLRCA